MGGEIDQWMIDALIVLQSDLAHLALPQLTLGVPLLLQTAELQGHWDPKWGGILQARVLSLGSTHSGPCLPL